MCMNDFMKGRNDADEFTIVLGLTGIVIAMIGSMARIQWLSWIAIAVIVLGVLRGMSKTSTRAARRTMPLSRRPQTSPA